MKTSHNITSFEDFVEEQHSSMDQAKVPKVPAPAASLPTSTRKTASTRKTRTRNWPAKSDEPLKRIASLSDHLAEIGDEITEIKPGMNSGRNLMAIFEDTDEEPRLQYNIRCKNGRSKQLWPNFKSIQEADLLIGTSLKQVCRFFPLHVWGDGLRIFIAEGWTAEEIWHELPAEARNDGAATRRWNYLQQAMGREADKMFEEGGNSKRVIRKRKRDGEDDEKEEVVVFGKGRGVRALDVRSPVIPTTPAHDQPEIDHDSPFDYLRLPHPEPHTTSTYPPLPEMYYEPSNVVAEAHAQSAVIDFDECRSPTRKRLRVERVSPAQQSSWSVPAKFQGHHLQPFSPQQGYPQDFEGSWYPADDIQYTATPVTSGWNINPRLQAMRMQCDDALPTERELMSTDGMISSLHSPKHSTMLSFAASDSRIAQVATTTFATKQEGRVCQTPVLEGQTSVRLGFDLRKLSKHAKSPELDHKQSLTEMLSEHFEQGLAGNIAVIGNTSSSPGKARVAISFPSTSLEQPSPITNAGQSSHTYKQEPEQDAEQFDIPLGYYYEH